MDILRLAKNSIIGILALQYAEVCYASKNLELSINSNKYISCKAFENFQSAYEYLKMSKDFNLTSTKQLRLAEKISQGCDNSFYRFKTVFELLNKSGVALNKSFEFGLEFSKLSDEQTNTFVEIFKNLYLNKKFDLDFESSLYTAINLVKDPELDIKNIKSDILDFVNYCTNEKMTDLPTPICGKWTLSVLENSPKFSYPIYQDFIKLTKYLIEESKLQLPVQDRHNLISRVLQNGPESTNNFISSIKWLSKNKDLNLSQQQIWNFAMEISNNSLKK